MYQRKSAKDRAYKNSLMEVRELRRLRSRYAAAEKRWKRKVLVDLGIVQQVASSQSLFGDPRWVLDDPTRNWQRRAVRRESGTSRVGVLI